MKAPDRRRIVATVVAGYVAVTVAESLLAPLLPVIETSLSLNLGTSGLGLAILAGSIAVGNLIGGTVATRWLPRSSMSAALVVTAFGSSLAASSGAAGMLFSAQAVIGLGAGIFFAPGIQTIGLAEPGKRGMAMGVFGVAFSIGLAIAAGIAVLATNFSWQLGFWIATTVCVAVLAGVSRIDIDRPVATEQPRASMAGSLMVPVGVGTVGTISQYGTVAFMAVYYVSIWGLSPAAAAGLIGAARILSVPGKMVVGYAIDRLGRRSTLRITAATLVATGVLWTTLEVSFATILASVVFAATVSGLFPIANTLALDAFAERGQLLGVYRSLQVSIGAAGAWAIGAVALSAGLRPALFTTAMIPVVLLGMNRIGQMAPAR